MALDSVHPQYAEMVPDWVQLRDFVKGERAVKRKGETYLPATKGMKLDGMSSSINRLSQRAIDLTGSSTSPTAMTLGQEVYDAYLLRAVFPEYMKDAIQIFMGMLHNKSAVIELPEAMEPLRERCTEMGESLELLLQRINLEQLTTGRVGLLLDLPVNPDPLRPMPFIALYAAESIRNWDDDTIGNDRADLNLVVLDESGYKRDASFQWNTVKKFRVLQLDRPLDADGNAGSRIYMCGAFSNNGAGDAIYNPQDMRVPMYRGRSLTEIPFVFINTMDMTPEPDDGPLISLARLCGAIYRGEADYRQNLFLQGQDTLVVIGERRMNSLDPSLPEEPLRTGAGSRIDLDVGGDAKYVGVNSQGLSEQRSAIENDRKRAESRSGQLIDAAKGDKESGTALRTRVGAQTATLNQIANTGAMGLERILKIAARWMGLDESKVKVTPNLEFADYQMSGQDLVNLMTAKRTGAPLSEESIHRLMVQGNLTRLDYPRERDLIDKEPPLPVAEPAPTAPKPGGELAGQGPAPADPANPAQTN